ncbi:UDP-glucose/GDP-mannose dehydrogenase family protein [Devosia sp. SD17-2]|uniref:UDP-glucose dehydrogenase family protein n=1 Tax=Devosia sp. SD17-2 TaxID=2976459 RepID=UPI0023D81029|nr:UDP-glucose/GDP-mannose dehydrogenase family protein [Devosia sp. SD17-2]WEJ33138.1 UDP-glucose/GDP-mannose dehydrogenase family protein [Devosia sp. SD17-2]
MRIAMIGSGYVGLVSGACFADFGHEVVCVDQNAERIASLNAGKIPIFEPGLDALVAETVKAGRLRFTTDLAPAVASAEVVFIAVGTPSRRGDGHADLSFVEAASAEIAAALSGFTVVVTKSTVPVGTGDKVEAIIRATNPAADVVVVSNPEFLREGAAIEDFKRPDRVIVGIEDERALPVMTEIYRPLSLNAPPLLFVDRRTAELTKYAGNAFLAMKIAFINEMADLCEKTGANVQDLARGIGLDGRIGSKFLNAGPGYGGSCFPKDTLALVRIGEEFGSAVSLVETTVASNERRKASMAGRVIAALEGNVSGKRVGILGLTFKPNTDDMRDSPALPLIADLQAAGAQIRAYDPEGMDAASTLVDSVTFCSDAYDAAADVDALVLVTEWNAFRSLDLTRLRDAMARPVFVDLRNVYRDKEMEAAGFAYSSIGRPNGSGRGADRRAAAE